MENKNSSGSSVCTKIRQTLGSKTKPLTPPRHKHHKEASGAIPIKLDHSPPNGNKAVSTIPKGASAHVGNSERATKVAAKVEHEPQPQYVPIQGKHPKKEGVQGHLGAQHVHAVHEHHVVNFEHQGKQGQT